MENLIYNIKDGAFLDGYQSRGYAVAVVLAHENQQKNGNKTIVKRIIDYSDIFNEERREHFSFDVIEII